MKKFTVLWLAGLLVLALGATGYAQAPKLDFRASGMIDVGTYYMENVPPYFPAAGIRGISPVVSTFNAAGFPINGLDKKQAYMDTRMHLRFDAVMGKELSGTVMFEMDATRWGGVSNATAFMRESGNFGSWATDRTAVEIKNIYMNVGLPYFGIPVPMTMSIGAQPLLIRPAFFVYTDGTGITGAIKADPVTIIPYYFKALEGLDWNADDVDVWGLQANAKLGTVTIGAYGLFYNMNTFPFQVGAPIAGFPATLQPTINGTMKSHMWWFGAYADGKLGPVNFNFDFVYDHGRAYSVISDVQNVAYRGWQTRLKIDFPWEKLNFGVIGMYATGSDAEKTSANGLPGSTTSTGENSWKVGSYVVPVGSEMGPINGESVVVYSMEAGASGGAGLAEQANYNQLSRGAFGGTWFAKAYGSFKVTPSYKVTVQGLYIGDTTKNGNTLGTAVIPGTTVPRDDSRIGIELDLINEYMLYKNLRLYAGAGYLWKGKALDLRRGTTTGNFSMNNPWAIRTGIRYMF